MRITPLDVRQQQFTVRMFRGFDVQEVDAFLQDVAEDYETILKENALLKEQLAVLEERARGFADLERALQDTLVTGQRMSEELKATARREAQLIVDEAQLRSEKVLDAARAEEARRLRVSAPPLEGRANAAVVDLIARAAGVARSAVSVVAGERSRDKLVRVAGVSAAALRARLGA